MRSLSGFGLLVLALVAPRGGAAAEIPASDRLIAHYRFDQMQGQSIANASGPGPALRVIGEVGSVEGKAGRAVQIGPGGYLAAAPSELLELGGELTLEAWVRPEAALSARILDRQTIGGSDGFLLDTHPGGRLRLILGPGSLQHDEPLLLGQWAHVAATYSEEAGEICLYRNGQLVASRNADGRLRPSVHPLHIGASRAGGDRFQGTIDEVRIYARALSPEEIAAHAALREIAPPEMARDPSITIITRDDQAHVDPRALCARNDLVYLRPARYPFEAMHLGNGNLGACLWNEQGLCWQLNNGSYRFRGEPVSSGKIMLSTPALARAESARFQQRLSLWDGSVETSITGAGGQSGVTSFVAEGEDCLVVRCREKGAGPRGLRLQHWRESVQPLQGDGFVALTEVSREPYRAIEDRLEATPNGMAMAVVVEIDGVAVRPERIGRHEAGLSWDEPAGEYTIYAAHALVPGDAGAAAQAARATIQRLKRKGYAAVLEEHAAFWHSFWPKSFLHITSPRGEGELMENLWYLFLYDMAAMSRRTLCPKFNGGNWLVAEDARGWGGSYWHQNTREMFWPVYAAGHAELSDPFVQLYQRMIPLARRRAKETYGAAGLHFWEVSTLDGGGIPRWPLAPSYHNHRLDVALEVAMQWYWRYEFTGDEQFLRRQVYPLLVEGLEFFLAYAKKGPDGHYHVSPSNAAETYWAVTDPHTDLAALRWALPLALELSERLGLDGDRRGRWKEFLDHLAPFAVDPEKRCFLPARLTPEDKIYNSENVALYGTYPYGLFGLGRPELDLALSNFRQRPVQGMGNGWEPSAIVGARLGLADEAARLALAHMRSNMRMNNGGWYSPTGSFFVHDLPDVPYFDSPGVCAQSLQEMALQSHGGLIRLGPAWPAKWSLRYRLWARGGFEIVAEIRQGKVRYALITSHRGGLCRLANPWGETAILSTAGTELLRSDKAELELTTAPGKTYRLERATDPVARMEFAALAPSPNTGVKFVGRPSRGPRPGDRALLGIDAQGRTPQRDAMANARAERDKRIAALTAGMVDLSTTKAVGELVDAQGRAVAAPMLVDGVVGIEGVVAVAPGQWATLALPAASDVRIMVFSRDGTALRCDGAAAGWRIEGSADGKAWTLLAEGKHPAAAVGEVVAVPPSRLRHLRIQGTGPYGQKLLLDEVTLFGR